MVSIIESFNDISFGKKAGLLFGVVFILVITVVLGIWTLSSKDAVLFSDMEESDAASIIEQLDEMKIPYTLENGGSRILVDEALVHEIRLKVMSKGMSLKSGIGFEVFDDAEFGMTEYTQKINYQRALQGELARTIMSLDEVKLARVHLVLPKTALFSEDKESAKASITLLMVDNATISKKQIKGIQNLVASSVTDMQVGQVTILNQKGETLTSIRSDGEFFAGSGAQLEEKQAIEAYLTKKAVAILDHTFGVGESIVRIDVTLNHDKIKRTTESVIPTGENSTGVLVRKRHTTAKQPVASGKKGKSGKNESSSTEVEYKVGREIEESVLATGEISRLSVGVMIPAPLSPEQIEDIEMMISMVVGLETSRGDAITIQVLPSLGMKNANVMQEEMQPSGVPASLTGVTNTNIEPVSSSNKLIAQIDINRLLKEPKFLYWIIGIVGLLFLLAIFWPRKRTSSNVKKKLTDEEREKALNDISDWIGVKDTTGEEV